MSRNSCKVRDWSGRSPALDALFAMRCDKDRSGLDNNRVIGAALSNLRCLDRSPRVVAFSAALIAHRSSLIMTRREHEISEDFAGRLLLGLGPEARLSALLTGPGTSEASIDWWTCPHQSPSVRSTPHVPVRLLVYSRRNSLDYGGGKWTTATVRRVHGLHHPLRV